MSDQREIVEQLRKTLQLLDAGSNVRSNNEPGEKAWKEIHPSFEKLEEYSKDYIEFTYENPTTYHLIEYFAHELEKAGFEYLSEKESWGERVKNSSNRKFYTSRNGTNLSAFIVGKKWEPSKGVGAIGAHADALTVKLKPSSLKDHVEGFDLLGVAPYGGTLNNLWFDRDLGIGGRVLYREAPNGSIKSKLINSAPQPIAKIPSLAPHFGSPAEGPFDKEDQAVPVVGYVSDDTPGPDANDIEKSSPLYGKHCLNFLRYVAKLAGLKVCQLVQLDLDLFDVQKGVIGGIKDDFLFAPRLDDRLCSYASMRALLESSADLDVDSMDTFVNVTLFDNEEIGSLSRQGARGGLFESVVGRVTASLQGNSVDMRALFANSITLSADVNHMFNPNFREVYMKNHSPKPNVGITLSLDPNVHMATDVVGTAFVEDLARSNGDKVQYFQIKNNSRSGGTIGPFIAAQTGARTVDLGIAQMAMHSIRATTGSRDIGLGVKFFRNFLQNWRPVYDKFGDL
ncbi:hypothetical protein HG536_0A04090 [Torulaspora globosa]|uniref:Uncharacterized protein n=1 Tax=Torulaspora globosa TaxID=48254 RepID=A0A7G3ZAQ5_9SACH|nr:uncharacterized protein HG536_0A04090 [Torulaspora globosa]QLL30591.1 hypothetical protein HG536_0A04090 [Torulaspora globosa]